MQWIHEDDLPCDITPELFAASQVIDGVRMYPAEAVENRRRLLAAFKELPRYELTPRDGWYAKDELTQTDTGDLLMVADVAKMLGINVDSFGRVV